MGPGYYNYSKNRLIRAVPTGTHKKLIIRLDNPRIALLYNSMVLGWPPKLHGHVICKHDDQSRHLDF